MSDEQWDPTKDECRRTGPPRPGREDRIRAEGPGGWKLDIMGPSIQGLQLSLLFVIAYALLWVIGPQLATYSEALRIMTVTLSIQTCANVERDPARAVERYEYRKRGHGR